MAILVLSQPEAVFPAFSRARLVLTSTGEETEAVLTVTALDFSHSSAFTREFFLENEDVGPVATFDLGEIARQLLFDGLTEVNAGDNLLGKAFIDHRLGVRFTASVTDGPSATFIAVNAAAKPGGTTLLWGGYVGTSWVGAAVVSSMPKLLFYPGYTDKSMVSVCLFPDTEGTIVSIITGGSLADVIFASEVKAGIVSVELPTFSSLLTADGGVIEVYSYNDDPEVPTVTTRYYLERRCVPNAPFYVRWINRLGGRDHWMFGRRSVLQEQTDDEVSYEPFYDRSEQAGQGQSVISLSAERVVTVGDEGVETAYFTHLKEVITSPLVEYYDAEVGKWLTVRVKDGRTTFNREDNLHGIELNLILPTKDLQF